MSHVVSIQTQVRDPAAVNAGCARLNLPAPTNGEVKLFNETVTGLTVQLSGWRYPIVCDTVAGKIRFDNFGGRWGDPREFNHFLQAYAVEKAKLEARRKGHSVTEQALVDGSIKLTIAVAGGAS